MKNILNRGFSDYSDDSFVTKVMFMLAQLTGNPAFPTTSPTLTAVAAALDVMKQAMVLPDPQARTTATEAARAKVEQMLDDLGDNLETTAAMDPVKLATTGFDMRKATEQTNEPPSIPQNVRLELTGVSGEAHLKMAKSERARGYQVQTAPDPAGPWTDYDTFSSVRGIILRGFPRAKDLWTRARALGPNNTKSGWSDPATILIN